MQRIRVSIIKTEQPIRNQESLQFLVKSMKVRFGLNSAGISKKRIKKKIKSVHRDLAIGIKSIQQKSFSSFRLFFLFMIIFVHFKTFQNKINLIIVTRYLKEQYKM